MSKSTPGGRRRMGRTSARLPNVVVGLATLIAALGAVLVVWAIAAAAFDDPNILPTPAAVWNRFIDLLNGDGDARRRCGR
jgi:ABC-type nitrate/sulfonate/bicarbonate transport system permease component